MDGLKHALKCLATCVEATEPDAKGHIFVYMRCDGCAQAMFCNMLMAWLEVKLNDQAALARLLAK